MSDFNIGLPFTARSLPDLEQVYKAEDVQKLADLIEQQQARIAELEQREAELAATVGYLRGILDDIDYKLSNHTEYADCLIDIRACIKDFHAVKDLPPDTNLNAVKRSAFIEGFNVGFSDCWITNEEEHAAVAIEIANQRYPVMDGE